jgi:RNA polymerase-binding transcription factor DksA
VRLLLRHVGSDRVEFALLDDDGRVERNVVVRVGSGPSRLAAVQFPSSESDATETTGDDELDREIRYRASEELARHEAAVRAMRDGTWAA